MIILAHDGSIYGDWVARYALQFAASEADRKLLLLHVLDGNINPDIVDARLARFEENCQEAGVDCRVRLLPLGKTVHRSLRQAIPPDSEVLLICGTRVKPNKRAFLGGSVAEQLLRSHQCPVLALRVVQPGLLGTPHDLLVPLAGHAHGFVRVWPVFRRLAAHLKTVYLFRALAINPLLQTHLTLTRKQALRSIGRTHLAQIGAEINAFMPLQPFRLDQRVTITTDWPHEILIFYVLVAGGWQLGSELAADNPLYRSATGIALATILLMQIGNLVGRRYARASGLDFGLFRNRLMVAGIMIQVFFSWGLLYLPPLQRILGTGPVNGSVYLVAWLGVPLIFGADYLRKRLLLRKEVHNNFSDSWPVP